MLEIAGLLAGELMVEQSDLYAVFQFGAGIGVGLLLAVSSLAACALECLGHEQLS